MKHLIWGVLALLFSATTQLHAEDIILLNPKTTITVMEHERSDGSTFTTATVTKDGERWEGKGWSEGTGDDAVKDAVGKALKDHRENNSKQSTNSGGNNVMVGPDGEGDLKPGGKWPPKNGKILGKIPIIITIGGGNPGGGTIGRGGSNPRGPIKLNYKTRAEYRRNAMKDIPSLVAKTISRRR